MKMLISIRRKREDSWMKMTKKTNIKIQTKKLRKTRFRLKNILQTGSAWTNQNNYNFIIFQRKWSCFCTNTLLFLGGVMKMKKFSSSLEEDPSEKPVAHPFPKQMQEKNLDEEKVEPEKEKPTDDENIKNKKKNQGKKRKFSSSSEEDPNEKPVAQQFPKQMQEKNRDEEEVEPEKEKPMDDENIKNKKKNQGRKRKFSSSSEEDPSEKPVAQQFPKLPLSQRRGTINSFDDSLLTDGKYEHNSLS